MSYVLVIILSLFFLFLYYLLKLLSPSSSVSSSSPSTSITPIPLAQPSLPFLGNALEYKKSPDQFLINAFHKYGGIFQINLAGMKTIILTSDCILKQFDLMASPASSTVINSSTNSSILSARDAVSDFGFLYTLGSFNIYSGTNIHKFIIKNYLSSAHDLQAIKTAFTQRIRSKLLLEVGLLLDQNSIPDFLHFIRRVILGTSVEEFLSSSFLEYYSKIVLETEGRKGDFIDDFMKLQDEIESATATAAVLPLWLAVIVCLKKCENHRGVMVKRLQRVIQKIEEDIAIGKLSHEAEGIWFRGIKSMTRDDNGGTYGTYEMAEIFIGLLFAAHKNPAIASAQAILFLIESSQNGSSKPSFLERAYQEVDSPASDPSTSPFLERVALETLRLTAHTIGAIRKVISPDGWTVEDQIETSSGLKTLRYHIPCGSYVGVSHIVPHHDPKKWGVDSFRFNPDRLNLIENCKDIRFFTTFSSGAHICPGRHLAVIIVRLVMTIFFEEYDVLPTQKQPHQISPLSFERATLAQRSGPCRIYIRKR